MFKEIILPILLGAAVGVVLPIADDLLSERNHRDNPSTEKDKEDDNREK
jgi:hypothetical protein